MTASRKAPERKAPTRKRATPRRRAADGGSGGAGTLSAPATGGAAHAGSKQSLLVARLSQPAGARIADLTKELNWLPHTVARGPDPAATAGICGPEPDRVLDDHGREAMTSVGDGVHRQTMADSVDERP